MSNYHCNSTFGMSAVIYRVALLDFDNLLDDVLSISFVEPSYDQIRTDLGESDKFHAYQQFWGMTLGRLYKEYLPHRSPPAVEKAALELTPFTFILCKLTASVFDEKKFKDEFRKRECRVLGIEETEIESRLENYMSQLQIDLSPLDDLPPAIRPTAPWDKLILFRRLMNFPPPALVCCVLEIHM